MRTAAYKTSAPRAREDGTLLDSALLQTVPAVGCCSLLIGEGPSRVMGGFYGDEGAR